MSIRTIWRGIESGEIESFTQGRARLIPIRAALAYIGESVDEAGNSNRPLSPLSSAFLATSAGVNETPTTQKVRVLAVDDDQGVRDYLEAVLSRQGHDVFSATTGEEALEMLETVHSDIVTLDMVMPGMDGLETLTHIRDARPDLPVIMLSGHGRSENVVHAMRLGAHNFLRKPFEVWEIERAFIERAFSEALGGDSR